MADQKTWRAKLEELTEPAEKEAYAKYRKQVVDELLDDVIQDHCPKCSRVSSGSTTATSDYDINISGPDAHKVVTEFNKKFQEIYKMTSAEKFDTNVYGFPRVYESVKHDHKAHERYIAQFRNDATPHSFEYIKTPITPFYQDLNTYNQHVWALRKLYESFTDLEKKNVKLKAYFFAAIKQAASDHRPLTIQESNVKYESFLHRLAETVNEFKDTGNVSNEEIDYLIVRYNDLVSHGNYHAQETYYSTGPYMDVVVNQQMKIHIPLSEDQYVDSYIENMAFAFDHLSCDGDGKATLDASKYLKRAYDALKKTSLYKESSPEQYEKIQRLDTIRSKFKEKSQPPTPLQEKCPDRSTLVDECIKHLDKFFECIGQSREEETIRKIKEIIDLLKEEYGITIATLDLKLDLKHSTCMKKLRTGDDTLTFIINITPKSKLNVLSIINELKKAYAYPVTYKIEIDRLAIIFEYNNFPFKIKFTDPEYAKQFKMNDTSMDIKL